MIIALNKKLLNIHVGCKHVQRDFEYVGMLIATVRRDVDALRGVQDALRMQQQEYAARVQTQQQQFAARMQNSENWHLNHPTLLASPGYS